MELSLHLFEWWMITPIILLYLLHEVLAVRRVKKRPYPLVGSSWSLLPRSALNFSFAIDAVRVIEEGYRKYKHQAFQLVRSNGGVIILPSYLIEELSSLPPSIASPHGALEHDLVGEYTGLNLILESRLHHSIVQRKLTPRLDALTPDLEAELAFAIDQEFPDCEDWTRVKPYAILAKISARLSARALVGPELCRDSRWLEISIEYTESLFKTIVVLRFLPEWAHKFICRLLPSYWRGQRYLRAAKKLLGPTFTTLLSRDDQGSLEVPNSSNFHVLTWLAETAKGNDRNPETLAHVEVLLALAAVHTTLLRMVNVLYDLTANPHYYKLLEDEIRLVAAKDWNHDSYIQLDKLDSIIRESQRLSPPTILGMKRLFRSSYKFADGLSVPQGSYTCLPIFAIENDPCNTPDPSVFEGLRSYNRRVNEQQSNSYRFASFDSVALNFGYGKSACPGRFFASLIVKMLFVKLITCYEFKFGPGQSRPKNMVIHEFLFPRPWDTILMRKRKDGTCPF